MSRYAVIGLGSFGMGLAHALARLGAEVRDNCLSVPFFGERYRISGEGVFKPSGEKANFAVSVVLCRYVIQCPDDIPVRGEWVTYREFRDAGPLVGYFTSNTNKIIETTFAGNTEALAEACRRLGGTFIEGDTSYDLCVGFDFLPRIPVRFRFNDRDDEFPAVCSVLFRRSAEKYLDMECLSIGGTYLTGTLIGS